MVASYWIYSCAKTIELRGKNAKQDKIVFIDDTVIDF